MKERLEKYKWDQFADILQNCLEDIQNGRGTVDSLLERHPALAGDLLPYLEAAAWLHAHKQALDPRPGFMVDSKRRLVARIKQESVLMPAASRFSLHTFISAFGRKRLFYQMVTAALLVTILMAGTSSLTLAARNSLPGDNLYGVKLAQERVQLVLSITAPGDARLRLDFTQRRLQEIAGLVEEKRFEDLEIAILQFEQQLGQALSVLEIVAEEDPGLVGELVEKDKGGILYHSQVLLGLLESDEMPAQSKPGLLRAYSASQHGQAVVSSILLKQGIPYVTDQLTPGPTLDGVETTADETPQGTPMVEDPAGDKAKPSGGKPSEPGNPPAKQTNKPDQGVKSIEDPRERDHPRPPTRVATPKPKATSKPSESGEITQPGEDQEPHGPPFEPPRGKPSELPNGPDKP